MKAFYSQVNIKLEKKEMICLVGAGGKTSSMFRLAQELSDEGKKVLATTTTAIRCPSRDQHDRIVIADSVLPDFFKDTINGSITVLGKSISNEGKLMGVNPELLDTLFLVGIFDYILVEGDGSKGRPIKAPAGHEPVIPSLTSKVLGLIGLDCIGKRVCPEYVHRPELFCRITGCSEGDTIDTGMVSSLIAHEEGLFKAVPEQAERYVVLNKADGGRERLAAGEIIQRLSNMGYEHDGTVIARLGM
jgi:probable selenium-dependent hydroxylase accessory protein YqeC